MLEPTTLRFRITIITPSLKHFLISCTVDQIFKHDCTASHFNPKDRSGMGRERFLPQNIDYNPHLHKEGVL
jgi:hypothetical protein